MTVRVKVCPNTAIHGTLCVPRYIPDEEIDQYIRENMGDVVFRDPEFSYDDADIEIDCEEERIVDV